MLSFPISLSSSSTADALLEPIPINESYCSSEEDESERAESIIDAASHILDRGDFLPNPEPMRVKSQCDQHEMSWLPEHLKTVFDLASIEDVQDTFGGSSSCRFFSNTIVANPHQHTVVAASYNNQQTARWQQHFQELTNFWDEYGHCCVPSYWPRNAPLAQCIKRQRYQYKLKKENKHSNLTDDRETVLEALGFVWDSRAVFWKERLDELCIFREKHGHCNVPTKYPDNSQLAIWAKCQRRQFKLHTQGSKRSNITLERISKLAELGFVFRPRKMKKPQDVA